MPALASAASFLDGILLITYRNLTRRYFFFESALKLVACPGPHRTMPLLELTIWALLVTAAAEVDPGPHAHAHAFDVGTATQPVADPELFPVQTAARRVMNAPAFTTTALAAAGAAGGPNATRTGAAPWEAGFTVEALGTSVVSQKKNTFCCVPLSAARSPTTRGRRSLLGQAVAIDGADLLLETLR